MNGTNCVFPNARQCSARSKRSSCQCRAPALKGWTVCRFHGANGGQKSGPANSQFRHGLFTQDAIAERRSLRAMLALSNAFAHQTLGDC
jgi:hypothetical protein